MTPPVDDLLATSCGQIRPITLIASLHNGQKVTKYVIQKPYAIIGRHDYCDISLPYPDVSNQHAYLQVLDGRLFCVDQQSRKWVYWKDKPRLYGWIDAGEWIQIGPYRITLELPVGEAGCKAHGAPNTKPFLSRYKTPSTTEGHLILNDQQTLPLQSQLTTIGRGKYCNLELEEEKLSKVHASIVRTFDGKYWMIDLKSGTGFKVNGHRCQSALLDHQDVIKIGSYSFTFQIVPKSDVRKPFSKSQTLEHPDNDVVEGAVSNHQPLLLEHVPGGPSNLMVRDTHNYPITLSSSEIPTQRQHSALVARPNSNLFIAPHIKLARPLSRAKQQAAPTASPDDFGLMDGLMQCMKQMQQDMMSQMRMNMEMMAEFMGNLQKQQMEMIREELAQLGKLNKELHELRQSLLTVAPAKKDEGKRQLPIQSAIPGGTKAEPVKTSNVTEKTARSKKYDSPSKQPAEKEGPPLQSHAWISKRIAILEKERQSKWEKMKTAVMGR